MRERYQTGPRTPITTQNPCEIHPFCSSRKCDPLNAKPYSYSWYIINNNSGKHVTQA